MPPSASHPARLGRWKRLTVCPDFSRPPPDMATFQHRRTGRTVEVSELRARGYRTDARWVELLPDIVVPEGLTVPKVLEWAGDDPIRRAAALAAEQAGKRRKGILDALG